MQVLVVCAFLLVLIQPALPTRCPDIDILMASEDEYGLCPRGCSVRSYCHEGRCVPCQACPDPYTLAASGVREIVLIPACINQGVCPNTCEANNFMPKANISLCLCADATRPPPQEVTCKEGCNHGGCEISEQCICDAGWMGELCDQCIHDCANGRCNSSGDCVCPPGWGGSLCDQDVTYCGNHQPCLNGGTCLDEDVSGYTCRCLDHFTGDNCENDETYCGNNQPCLNSGTCSDDGTGGYTCKCTEDFTGTNCDRAMKLRRCEETCYSNGTCKEVEPDVYQCQCEEGFSGTHCNRTEERFTALIIVACVCVGLPLVLTLYCCCRKLGVKQKCSYPLTNDGIQLISEHVRYERLADDTVLLKDLQKWPCHKIQSCECLPDFPVAITDDMRDYAVHHLRNGFTYSFEICRPPAVLDAEDSWTSAADCDITIDGLPDEGHRCSGNFRDIEDDITLRRGLNLLLADSDALRKCIVDFFGLRNHQKEVMERPGSKRYSDDLFDILQGQDKLDRPVAALLSHVEERGPAGMGDLARLLAGAHPSCAVCPRFRHHMHGGVTVWKSRDVVTEMPSNSFANNTHPAAGSQEHNA